MSQVGTEWTVTVHRDFEDFLQSWKDRAAGTTGVLHVGFARPPAREFEHLVATNTGRLLLTAAAKFALPDGYTASEGIVGIVREMPVHVGVRGWGYEIAEDELPRVGMSQPPEVGSATGWVEDFLAAEPSQVGLLRDHAIFDDRNYFDREAELPWSLRRDLGLFRFKETFAGEGTNPCDVARGAPPWLLARRFDTIDVPVRVANVFTNMGIVTVADLAHVTLAELLDVRNFGRKSANDLLSALKAALNEGPVALPPYDLLHDDFRADSRPRHRAPTADVGADDDQEAPEPQVQFHRTLVEAIHSSLRQFNERDQEIVLRRMGLGQPSETLQELGERFGVTRARIGQIEANVIGRLIKRETWDDELTAKLAHLTAERSMPLPLRGIEGADPWFAGMGNEGEALAYLLENVSKGPANVIEIGGTQYLGALTQQEWDVAEQGARRLLESGVDQNWSFEHCQALVQVLLPQRCSEFRQLLWESASLLAYFVEQDGTSILSGYGRGAENYVYAILSSSPDPIHYSEIPRLVLAKYDREIDVRRAHNAAAQVGLLFGRGVYGLSQHVRLPDETMTRLAEEAYQIIVEGPVGRQWHAAELMAELVERDVAGSSDADKFLLNIALKRLGGVVHHLGRFVWSLAGGTAEAETYRIDIRQAIVLALQQAAAPLSTEEIRKRVAESRGVDKLFQIFPSDPIIRVAPGVWGLNDRDLPIKRSDQGKFLDALVGLLRDRGSGVHHAELEQSAALKSWGLTVTAFFSLATTDPRLRASSGRYLYLEEWGGPRRESLSQAVRGVLLESERPLTIADVADRVASRLRRSIDRPIVSAQLKAVEAVYNPVEGTWSMATAGTTEPEAQKAAGSSPQHMDWADQSAD